MVVVPRQTRQRAEILDLLEDVDEFRSAQQLHEMLRARGSSVGLATVYRAVQSLSEHGDVDVLRTEDGESVYRRCEQRSHHHHLVCRSLRADGRDRGRSGRGVGRPGRRGARVRRRRPHDRARRHVRHLPGGRDGLTRRQSAGPRRASSLREHPPRRERAATIDAIPTARPAVRERTTSNISIALPAMTRARTTRPARANRFPADDELRLEPPAEQDAVQAHGRDEQRRRQHGQDHEHQVEVLLVGVEVREPLLERDRQQEAREDLRAGLRDPQLLQQLVPVAVGALVVGLVRGRRPGLRRARAPWSSSWSGRIMPHPPVVRRWTARRRGDWTRDPTARCRPPRLRLRQLRGGAPRGARRDRRGQRWPPDRVRRGRVHLPAAGGRRPALRRRRPRCSRCSTAPAPTCCRCSPSCRAGAPSSARRPRTSTPTRTAPRSGWAASSCSPCPTPDGKLTPGARRDAGVGVRRRAPRAAGRRLDHAVDRAGHRLHARRGPRAGGPGARARACGCTSTAPGSPTPPRALDVPLRAFTTDAGRRHPVARRHQERPAVRRGRRRARPRGGRRPDLPAQDGHAARVEDAVRRPRSSSRCSRATCGCAPPGTPTRWRRGCAPGIEHLPGVQVTRPTQANGIFVIFPRRRRRRAAPPVAVLRLDRRDRRGPADVLVRHHRGRHRRARRRGHGRRAPDARGSACPDPRASRRHSHRAGRAVHRERGRCRVGAGVRAVEPDLGAGAGRERRVPGQRRSR